jgi:hypothetical protein
MQRLPRPRSRGSDPDSAGWFWVASASSRLVLLRGDDDGEGWLGLETMAPMTAALTAFPLSPFGPLDDRSSTIDPRTSELAIGDRPSPREARRVL